MRPCVLDAMDGRLAVEEDRSGLRGVYGEVSRLLGCRADDLGTQGPLGDVSDQRLRAPVDPGKIIAIGLNYRDHIAEAGVDALSVPLVFAKLPSSIISPDEPIVIDRAVTERADWEVELAVVIGRRMRNVAEEYALSHVFGYTVANDVSAGDVQFGDGQWVRGKSLDMFCPVGPCVVRADEIPDPQSLRMRTRVNGETVQDASTSQMVFSVAKLLAYCSRSLAFKSGDLALAGTPRGWGEFMTPKRSLQDGDLVAVEIDAIGTLRNPVVVRSEVPA